MIIINKDLFDRILSLSEDEEEKQKIKEFIEDESNNDFLEEVYLITHNHYGWATLSSGKTVYVKQPMGTPEEVGNAFKLLAERLK